MKAIRKIIEIDEELCDGCGECVPGCAEGALQIIDGKARVVADNLCDGLGACIGDCPTNALKIVERAADEFDEEAVEKHLAMESEKKPIAEETMACGCPSAQIKSFVPASPCQEANKPASFENVESALSHWPIKIRLVPAKAPFLKGADLLVLADCCGVAYTALHQDFLKGRVVMMGCPKFDNAEEYIDKFAEIFQVAGIKSVTSVFMEVPCCSGLPVILEKAMEKANVHIPIEKVVIGGRGKIVERTFS